MEILDELLAELYFLGERCVAAEEVDEFPKISHNFTS